MTNVLQYQYHGPSLFTMPQFNNLRWQKENLQASMMVTGYRAGYCIDLDKTPLQHVTLYASARWLMKLRGDRWYRLIDGPDKDGEYLWMEIYSDD